MSPSRLPVHAAPLGPDPSPERDTYVLVHGYGASMFTWRRWAPKLAERGHVVQVDMKGFGQAPKPDDGRYAPTDQAELIHGLLEERDLSNVTLVGHSLGGGVALLTALRLLDAGSDRLRRLVIVCGTAYPQRLPPFVGLAERPRVSGFLFRLVGARRVVRNVLRGIVQDRSTVTPDLVRGYADPLRSREAVRALIEAANQIVPPDLDRITPRYAEIDVPALLLWGRQDRVVPLGIGQRLAEAMPRARLHVLEGCGHIPTDEKPDESWAVLADFLASTAPGST